MKKPSHCHFSNNIRVRKEGKVHKEARLLFLKYFQHFHLFTKYAQIFWQYSHCYVLNIFVLDKMEGAQGSEAIF